jgi:hypothetical protein
MLLCGFSDARSDDLAMRSDGRRPKSANARNRVRRWRVDDAAADITAVENASIPLARR